MAVMFENTRNVGKSGQMDNLKAPAAAQQHESSVGSANSRNASIQGDMPSDSSDTHSEAPPLLLPSWLPFPKINWRVTLSDDLPFRGVITTETLSKIKKRADLIRADAVSSDKFSTLVHFLRTSWVMVVILFFATLIASPLLILVWSTLFNITGINQAVAIVFIPWAIMTDPWSGPFISFCRAFVHIPSMFHVHLGNNYVTALVMLICIARKLTAMHLRNPDMQPGEKARVLLVGDSFYPKCDGVATFTRHSIANLVKEGHTVWTMHAHPRKKFPDGFVAPHHRVKMPGISEIPQAPGHVAAIPAPVKIFKTLMQLRPHVVHCFECGCLLNVGLVSICAFFEIPCIISHHTHLARYSKHLFPFAPNFVVMGVLRIIHNLVLPYASLNLVVSTVFMTPESLLSQHLKHTLPRRKPQLWVSGTDTLKYDPKYKSTEKRNMLAGGAENAHLPLVIHVGRLAPEKDCAELPACFHAIARAMNKKVRFAIVGGGHDFDKICAEMEQGEAAGLCVYPGWQSGHDLVEIYASADCFFSPSCSEGFPLVYLEAMNSGLPPIGPRDGGTVRFFILVSYSFFFQFSGPGLVLFCSLPTEKPGFRMASSIKFDTPRFFSALGKVQDGIGSQQYFSATIQSRFPKAGQCRFKCQPLRA